MNKEVMYCVKNKCVCDYSNKTIENPLCDYENRMGKTYDTCEYATRDFDKVVVDTFTDLDYENFGKEMYLYEHNKYINKMIQSYLDTCYSGRDINSSMEDMAMIFYRRYALREIERKKKESY